MIQKAFKYRLYPTDEQKQFFEKNFGINRLLWNSMLDLKSYAWKAHKKDVKAGDMLKEFRALKNDPEFSFIKDAFSDSFDYTRINFDQAFQNFFRRVKKGEEPGYPKFKSRNRSNSYQIKRPNKINFADGFVSLPKIGDVRLIVDRSFNGEMRTTTISRTPTGKYFVSILVNLDFEKEEKPVVDPDTTIGIDVNIDEIVASDGQIFEMPKHLKNSLTRLRVLSRRASKKKKGSANAKKAWHKVALLHERVANQRKYWQHQTSNAILESGSTIAIEDLNLAGMKRSAKGTIEKPGKMVKQKSGLNRSLSDAAWGGLFEKMHYKADWYGKNIIKAGRWDASSKTCSCCGEVNKGLKLKDRTWMCDNCATVHNRDYNAAINIKNMALAKTGVFSSVEPVESLPVGRTLKQESAIVQLKQFEVVAGQQLFLF